MIHCPKKHKPDIERIEVTYLGSLYEDIGAQKPLIAGIKEVNGITLGHVITQPPYIAVLLGEFGFYDLLNETGIDYIIADPYLTNFDNVNYFLIPCNLGYVISNYEGIRFAIVSKGRDSLTIQDQIAIEIVNQRSDIMWMIDPAFLMAPPMTYYFYVQNRGLADTSAVQFETAVDTLLVQRFHDCARGIKEILERSVALGAHSIEDFTLSTLARNEDADVVLYPPVLFREDPDTNTVTIAEFINAVACEQQFYKDIMTEDQVVTWQEEHDLMFWGTLIDTNTVLYPVLQGEYLFDLLSLVTIPTKY